MAHRTRAILAGILCLAALGLVSAESRLAGAAAFGCCPPGLAALIPPRKSSAPTGSQVAARVASLRREERAHAFVGEILGGNIPDFLRRLRPVETSVAGPLGVPVRAVLWVMPDYLAVGSDEDFVRVPLGLPEALAVARRFGFTLPTRKIVNAIHEAAEAKVDPKPMPAGPRMTSVAWLLSHSHAIDGQLRRSPPGSLVSGVKKDVVITPRLAAFPGKEAIYGWLRPDGTAIQPLSTVHAEWYADYSHGVRLVSDTVFVDGEARSVFDLLEDPSRVALLSDEGVDGEARRLLGRNP
jgi:hypothetical protein